MPEIYYSNLLLDDDRDYFLYIGELKNYGLNVYLREALSRITERPFDFISIVPDVFEQYTYPNLMVINPQVETDACRFGPNFACRISATSFMSMVSAHPAVLELVERLRRRQDTLWIYMYESLPEMTLDRLPGVRVIGPDSQVARRVNSKTYQFTRLSSMVPAPEFHVCRGIGGVLETAGPLWEQWTDGIVVTCEFSAAGVNSMVAHSAEAIRERFGETSGAFLITRYIPHEADPTVLAVVAGEDDIYIAGVADQCIDGTRFTGSRFPSALDTDTQEALKDLTRRAGNWLAGEGYRGIYGCDYIIDRTGQVFFLEINARKQGTTLEFCNTLEQSLGPGAPMLPELEYHAVVHGCLPSHAPELTGNPKQIHWGTYNYKIHRTVRTNGYIPQSGQERDAFRNVAGGNLKKDYLILEHTGHDFVVAQGSFIARIVSLGLDRESVEQGLSQGRKTIELTITEAPELEDSNA
jgi:hypothetical protein